MVGHEPVPLVVIAGITIGNAVPSAVLGVNQSISLCRDHTGDLEAMLSLGFDRRLATVATVTRAAVTDDLVVADWVKPGASASQPTSASRRRGRRTA